MRQKMPFVLLFILFSFVGNLRAQEELKDNKLPAYTIAVQPFYLVNGGLRLDFEKRIKDTFKFLQLSLSGFYLPEKGVSDNDKWDTFNSGFDEGITGLKGIGIGGAYKSFVSPRSPFYLSGGLSYTLYEVNYPDYQYVSFVEDGMRYYEHRLASVDKPFHKIQPSVCCGLQTHTKFFLDMYIGIGYSISIFDKGNPEYNFDDTIWGYGYNGLTLSGGFRIGFSCGK